MTDLKQEDPSRIAILVVDVQPVFIGLPLYPPVDGVLHRLKTFVSRARAAGALIVDIRIAIPKDCFTDVWEAQYGVKAPNFAELIAPDSPESQFHPDFAPEPGDLVVVKTRYSAFVNTTLESTLRSRGVTTVVVAGLTADVCVGSTARDAFQREFHVITLSDCTAEATQQIYESCLGTLQGCFGRVMTSDELLALWDGGVQVP